MSSRNLDHSILADPQPCSLAAGVVVLGQLALKDVAEAVPSTVQAPRNGNENPIGMETKRLLRLLGPELWRGLLDDR